MLANRQPQTASALRTSGQPLNDSLRHDNDEAEDEDDTRADDSDDSGDDFDEFEEGEEAGAGGDDDDFGDFDDFEEGQGSAEFEEPPPTVSAPAPVPIAPSVPVSRSYKFAMPFSLFPKTCNLPCHIFQILC